MREWVVFAEMVQDSIAEDLDRRGTLHREGSPRFASVRRVLAWFLFRAARWIAPPVPIGEHGGFREDAWRISRI